MVQTDERDGAVRILVVEDEPKTGDYLRKGLTESGFVVDLARTGVDGRHLALNDDYDLIVLDVTLPGIDGWGILKYIRQEKQTPVVMLTAKDQVDDRVKGLELGADDYLVKPFAFVELLARIRSVLRRGTRRESDVLQIGDLEIDALKRRVIRGGDRIDLTTKEYSLLYLLALHPGEVQARTVIASRVWDMNFDSDTNVVDVAIRRLRAKIDDPYPTKLIHTVRGAGYVLEQR
jgi:two-component system copper resistance phosphate regulon response regulator CusR